MPKTLVICETRLVADALSRALGGRFVSEPTHFEGPELVITWSDGQLAGLADPEAYDPGLATWRIDDLPIVPERFEIVARAGPETAREQLKAIRALMRRRDVERLVNALDPGPEGELAFAYLRELTQAELPVARARLTSLGRPAIRRAFAELRPGAELAPLEDAARTRAEADWLVGVNGTRAATVRARALGGRVTLGRVLTPALALLVHREREIEAFTPAGDEVVDAAFEPASGSSRYLGRSLLGDAAAAGEVAARLEGAVGSVQTITVTREDRPAPRPYGLAALQRDALLLHGMSARRTADAAYECYEQAVLTYPSATGDDTLTTVSAPGVLGDDARRIHDLVARRSLAVTLPPAVLEHTEVVTRIEEQCFRSRGVVLREAGWYATLDDPLAQETAADDDAPLQELPELLEGLEVRCVRSAHRRRETSPPARLDDAALVAATDGAVDAATIERLIQLGYAARGGPRRACR
jgi:DNA topoisomerase-3